MPNKNQRAYKNSYRYREEVNENDCLVFGVLLIVLHAIYFYWLIQLLIGLPPSIRYIILTGSFIIFI